jgi:hypothetical protein
MKKIDKNDPALIQKVIHEFSIQSQDINKIQGLLLTHGHFVTSDALLEALIVEYDCLENSCRKVIFLFFFSLVFSYSFIG